MAAKPSKNLLYPNEKLVFACGFPALSWFKAGGKTKPLVLFLTGGGVLARIAYGHPESRPDDFLAYWFYQEGHSFLALTYPMDHPVFPTVHPEFTVHDWGKQSSEIVSRTISQQRLPKEIIIVAWSMAGRVVGSVTKSLRKKGIEVRLCVGLAANTPASTIIVDFSKVKMSSRGLGEALLTPGFKANLRGIPMDLFQKDYLGNYPMNLASTSLRYRRGRFVADPAEDLLDTEAWDYSHFPLVSLLYDESFVDARHALLDKEVWRPYISQVFFQKVIEKHLKTMKKRHWRKLLLLFRQVSDQLSRPIKGTHFFFVGKKGAKTTVAETKKLLNIANRLCDKFEKILLR